MVGKSVSPADLAPHGGGGGGPLPFDDFMVGVRAEFAAVADDPAKFPYSAPLAGAVLINFDTPRGAQLARILHHANPERRPEEAYRLVRSGLVAQFLQLYGDSYPSAFTSVETCLTGIQQAQTTFPYGNRLNEIYRGFDLSTTIWKRYATAKILGYFMLHRNGGEGRTRADIGCSDFTGMTAVRVSHDDPQFSFAGIDVLDKVNGLWVPSEGKRDLLGGVVSEPDSAGITVGADRVNPRQEIVRRFIAGSMTPEELKDGTLPSGHLRLLQLLYSGQFDDELIFVEADVAHKRGRKEIREAADGDVDEAFMILAWHQGRKEQRQAKFAGMHDIVGPSGVAVFVDFARRDNSGPEPRLAPVQWADLNVIVSAPDEDGNRQLLVPMQWTDGRCHRVRFTRDLVTLARGGPYEKLAEELAGPA